jgi:uncharacterized protein (DUF362 family)
MTLAELIAADPDGRGYASMTDAQIADDINNKRHATRKRVPIADFAQAIVDNGVMQAVVAAELDIDSAAHATAKLVQAMLDNVQKYGINDIDMDKPGNDALFNAMESSGLMNETQRAELEALADVPASLADIHGLGRVKHTDVARITGGVN